MSFSRRAFVKTLGVGGAAALSGAYIPRAYDLPSFWTPALLAQEGPILLHNNEHPLGPGEKVLNAIREHIAPDGAPVGRYPFALMRDLVDAIAQRFDVQPGNIILGTGSTQVLRTAVQRYTSPTRALVTATPTYEECTQYAQLLGHAVVEIGLNDRLMLDLDEMADNLGKSYRVQDALMIKKYPCCGGNHAMLDSLFSLMRDNDFTYEDVADAEVDQSYYSVVMLYQDPDDELKGKFSAKYNVAAALVDGEVAVDTFTKDKIAAPTINETMGKVRTRVMAKSEEMLTRSEDGHKVKITLKDGRVFEHVTARADILGSQKNPWGFDNIKAKFQENVALVLSEQGVEDAVNAWSDILQVSDVSGTISKTLSN